MSDEYQKETMAFPNKADRVKKYQHIIDMEVRDPETKVGETIIYDNNPANYTKLCSGILPRYNRTYAPMHWSFRISPDKSKIMIQRTA